MPIVVPKIIGHRGAAAYAPENTLAAFNKALALGCRLIEFDVMCSKDGEPFVFHDDNLKRTTNGRGNFSAVNADYLINLDAGKWFANSFQGEKIPHFKTALDWLTESNMQANIEIKASSDAMEASTTIILNHIHRYWPADKNLPLVSSFNWEVLRLCRQNSDQLPLGLLVHDWDESYIQTAKQLACYSIHFNQKILNQQRVQAAKAAGYVICAYTVNHKRLANKLFDWGVDAVFSDYPDLLA